jgi:hypothetical protein
MYRPLINRVTSPALARLERYCEAVLRESPSSEARSAAVNTPDREAVYDLTLPDTFSRAMSRDINSVKFNHFVTDIVWEGIS